MTLSVWGFLVADHSTLRGAPLRPIFSFLESAPRYIEGGTELTHMTGLRVELELDSPRGCPVADVTASASGPATQIAWSDGEESTVEQFTIENDRADTPESIRSIFEYGETSVYEFERENADCPCGHIEATGTPVADVRAEDGSLFVTLHLADGSALSDLLADLRATFGDVSIRTISRANVDDVDDVELVPIDRSQLTDRQQEVLETAFAMGYFEYPRGANASEVADALGICPSTLAEHMAAAQSKVLTDLLGTPEA